MFESKLTFLNVTLPTDLHQLNDGFRQTPACLIKFTVKHGRSDVTLQSPSTAFLASSKIKTLCSTSVPPPVFVLTKIREAVCN